MIRALIESDIEPLNSILKTQFHTTINLDDPFIHYWVYGKEEILGIISYSILYDVIDLNYIWVKESSRNKGIASQLLQHMICEAQKKQIDKITLEVCETNEVAIHLYEKFGFVKKAIRKNYYGNKDGILMLLEVR